MAKICAAQKIRCSDAIQTLSATLALLTLASCAELPVQPGAESALREGSRLEGGVTTELEVHRPIGEAVTHALPTERFEAVVRNSIALPAFGADAGGADALHQALRSVPIAIASSEEAPGDRTVSFRDEHGRVHEIAFLRQGRRLISAEHSIDGERFAAVHQQWDRSGEGWVLQRVELSVASHGTEANLTTRLGGLRIVSGGFTAGAGDPRMGGASLFQPVGPDLSMAEAICLEQILTLMGTSGALAASIGLGQWWYVPSAGLLYLASIINYYEECIQRNS